jgi:hypothetical protein
MSLSVRSQIAVLIPAAIFLSASNNDCRKYDIVGLRFTTSDRGFGTAVIRELGERISNKFHVCFELSFL